MVLRNAQGDFYHDDPSPSSAMESIQSHSLVLDSEPTAIEAVGPFAACRHYGGDPCRHQIPAPPSIYSGKWGTMLEGHKFLKSFRQSTGRALCSVA